MGIGPALIDGFKNTSPGGTSATVSSATHHLHHHESGHLTPRHQCQPGLLPHRPDASQPAAGLFPASGAGTSPASRRSDLPRLCSRGQRRSHARPCACRLDAGRASLHHRAASEGCRTMRGAPDSSHGAVSCHCQQSEDPGRPTGHRSGRSGAPYRAGAEGALPGAGRDDGRGLGPVHQPWSGRPDRRKWLCAE